MIGKKRLALVAGTVTAAGAVATLAAGTTFGLFSASATQASSSTFSVGSVSVGNPVNHNCQIQDMVPGDASAGYDTVDPANNQSTLDATCSFSVDYTGSVPAFIGLTTDLSGTLGDSLQWQIRDGDGHDYATSGDINTNSASDQLYVATDPGNDNTTYTIFVDYALPLSETSQNLTDANLDLTVTAVQAGNNGDDSACTAGSTCPGITSWGA